MNYSAEKPHILAIDDTPVHLMALGRILSPLYEITMARNGEAGLKVVEERTVDMILLDLFMDDMSGFDVLMRLKKSERTKNIPVIFITGSDSGDDEEKGLALGAVDYIRKPFSEAVVNLRVGVHLQLLNQKKIIEKFALMDELTGTSHKRGFDIVARYAWSFAMRKNGSVGFLLVGIDEFKTFNRNHGYRVGDACLKSCADVIKKAGERGSDAVFRWSGDEFAVLLPDTTIEGTAIVAKRILENIAATPVHLADGTAFVTASIGAGSIVAERMDFDEMFPSFVSEVCKVQFRAKENGRNRIERSR